MINASIQKEALTLAGLLSKVMVQTLAKLSMLSLTKPDMETDPVISGQLRVSFRPAQTLSNSFGVSRSLPGRLTCRPRSDYRETRELANWMMLFNSGELPESSNSLISSISTNGGSRAIKDEYCSCSLKPENYSGSAEHYRYSGSTEHNHYLGSPVIHCGCTHVNHQPIGKEKVSTANAALLHSASVDHSSGASTFALRRSALSFLPQASSTHEEKLALGLSAFSLSTLDSIPATSSCGKRIAFLSDLLFLFPVAISNTHVQLLSGNTPYIKDGSKKTVDVVAHQNVWWSHTLSAGKAQVIPKITTPRSGGTLPRRLTKPLTGVTTMAGSQHTQTHPKFTWRFLALSASARNVIHITAATEREARDQSPTGCVMVFAGRLPVQEANHA